MVMAAGEPGRIRAAADLAAVLVERGLGGDAVDLTERVERFRRDRSQRAQDMRRMAEGWARMAERNGDPSLEGRDRAHAPSLMKERIGPLLALAYPDRLAKARGKPGAFLMANGRGAALEPHKRLACEPFLAVAELAGGAAAARILAAAPISLADVEDVAFQHFWLDKRIGPQGIKQFIVRNQPAGVVCQIAQNSERLRC